MPDVRSATAALLTAPAISPALVIRPPVQPFKPTSETLPKIWFRHPAYDDRENKLLVLYGFDSRGLHHETARIACCILASCPWEDGYLSLTRDGPGVVLGPDDVLTATSYYFQADIQYAVVPSFKHYRFPETLPDSWLQEKAPILPSPRLIDRYLVTYTSIPLEGAHIVPASHVDWWKENQMQDYAREPPSAAETHCPDNLLRLRKDVHTLWDAHRIAIVPKLGAWTVHVLHRGATDDLETLYHNQQLQPVAGVCRQYLLARFAMAVFSMSLFVSQFTTTRRRILYIKAAGDLPQVGELTPDQIKASFGPPATRTKSSSRSPNKRTRAATPEDGDNPCYQDDDSCYHDDTSTCYSEAELDSDAGGCCRGMKLDTTVGCCPSRDLDDSGVEDSDEMDRGRPRKRIRV